MAAYIDEMVQRAQIWLNKTYKDVAGYNDCPEDGRTGWQTMYSLTRALQHELGIATLSNNFGPTTMARLDAHGPVGNGTAANILKIVQSACFCKGYHAGDINGEWDNRIWGHSTSTAIYSLMGDLGLADYRDDTIRTKVFKALLTMDAYILLSGGNSEVRSIQRWLNGAYWQKSFASLVPCDGFYSRDVQQGLMKALQLAVGIPEAQVNGNFGTGTKQGLRDHPLQQGDTGLFVKLLSAACVFNGEVPTGTGEAVHTVFKDTFDTALGDYLSFFQDFSLLPKSRRADYATWCQLLVSSGDPDRPAMASDTRFTITESMARSLASTGYKTVGRYLANDPNGWDKDIKPGELDAIFNGGMKIFPIYQLNARQLVDFTFETGRSHGEQAHDRMVHYGFNPGAIIYFSVDYDATGEDIKSNIIPYFRGIQASLTTKGRRYRAGVYGSRNVCTRVSQETLVVSSFVSGMSWGFSGNLGFPLPFNWAFNQIKEIQYTGGGQTIDLDRDVHRTAIDPGIGRDGVGGTTPSSIAVLLDFIDDVYAEAVTYGGADPNVRTLEYLRSPRYTGTYEGWDILLPHWDQRWIDHAAALFDARRGPLRTYADPSYGDEINIDHLAATANAVLVKNAGSGNAVTRGDFGGWGGDLATFYADWRNNRTSFASAHAFCTARLAVRGTTSSWSFTDMVEDVDGHLLGLACQAGGTFPDALRNHLTGVEHTSRFGRFYSSRFGSSLSAAKAAASTMLLDVGEDDTLDMLRDLVIIQSSSPLVVLPRDIPTADLNSFISGFADRIQALAAIG